MINLFKKKSPVLIFKHVRLFGKLPGFSDFVRFRSADPEAIRLDAWVNSGLASLMNQGMHEVLEKPWTLSMCQHKDKAYHLATLMNSVDKSGRHYPLVLLAEVENPWLDDYKPSFPLLFHRLQELGSELQTSNIYTQSALIDKLHDFERKTMSINKREVLEERINALNRLTQDQAWGGWAETHPELNKVSWKIGQLEGLNKNQRFDLPMGSHEGEKEASYWLQLLEDRRDIKHITLHYFWLCSAWSKKMIVQLGEADPPSLQTLFRPYITGMTNQNKHCQDYDGNMNLLSATHYWKKA